MGNKYWVLILIIALFSLPANSQDTRIWSGHKSGWTYWKPYVHPINTPWSVEARSGISIYTGELSNLQEGNLQNGYRNFSWGLGLDYRVTHFIKIALKAKRFRLASHSEPEFWANRSFSTKNIQYTISLEHSFIPHGAFEELEKRVNPYISLGLGFNRYRTTLMDPPQTNSLEIKESTIVIPLGLGVAYFINQSTHLAIEGHFYATGSDSLDGTYLSTGSQGKNDGYFMLELKYCWQVANGFKYKNHLKRKGM